MNIDCADGEELAYDGCIEMDLDVIGKIRSTVGQHFILISVLIVPDSYYNPRIPFY